MVTVSLHYPLSYILQKKEEAFWQRMRRPFWEHHVFAIGEYYYKFPNYPTLFHGNQQSYAEIALRKHQLVSQYFWDSVYIPTTTIIPREDSYIIEQIAIVGEPLGLHHLKDKKTLWQQLEYLLEINDRMRHKEWFALDMCGTDMLTDPLKIHNILTDGTKLYPIDTVWLLDKKSKNIMYKSLSHGIMPMQKKIIKWLLQLTTMKERIVERTNV